MDPLICFVENQSHVPKLMCTFGDFWQKHSKIGATMTATPSSFKLCDLAELNIKEKLMEIKMFLQANPWNVFTKFLNTKNHLLIKV